MGKLILISGANSSGKSRYAESVVAQTEGRRYYIATMSVCSEENERRVEKHRRQRQGLAFETLECPHQVGTAAVTPEGIVLLEDVSNLLANNLFETGKDTAAVLADIEALQARCRLLVAVTISGLREEDYDGETAAYIQGLNALNRQLMSRASAAVAMREQQPVYLKGRIYDCI